MQRQMILSDNRNMIKDRAARILWVSLSLPLHKINAGIRVHGSDNEFNFEEFKSFVKNFINSEALEFTQKSCILISDEVYEYIATRYPNRMIEITVSTNDDNDGSTIYYHTL